MQLTGHPGHLSASLLSVTVSLPFWHRGAYVGKAYVWALWNKIYTMDYCINFICCEER